MFILIFKMNCHFYLPEMHRKHSSQLIHLQTGANLRGRNRLKENRKPEAGSRKPEAGSCYFVFIHLVQMQSRAQNCLWTKIYRLSACQIMGLFPFKFVCIYGIWMVKRCFRMCENRNPSWWAPGKKIVSKLTGVKRCVFDQYLRWEIFKTCWKLKF